MADEIVIGKLIIDTADLENSMSQSKKAIVDLQGEQKKLTKDTNGLADANDEQLKTFVANELELKRMKSEYAANQKSVLDLTRAQLGLDSALAKQNKTQDDAVANTKELTIARKAIDATTVEGAKAINDINAKIDQNNKFVNESSSALEKQKNNVGNYPEIMGKVGTAFGGATQQAIGFVQTGRDIVGVLGAVNTSVVNGAKNIVGFGNASKIAAVQSAEMATANTGAAVATEGLAVAETTATATTSLLNVALAVLLSPITLIIAALGLVVFLFKDLDPVLDKIEQGFAAVSAVVSVLTQSILGFITGAKGFIDSFGNIGGAMADAAKEAADLKEAQQDLADAQKSQEVSNARASQQYDELILKSKNRTLTEQERIAFLNKAQAIETANFRQRAALAQAELDNAIKAAKIKGQLSQEELDNLQKNTVAYATYLLNTGKITDKELDNIIAAEKGKIEVQAESTRRLEKSQNAEDKLADDAEKKAADRAAKAKAAAEKANAEALKNAQARIDILKLEAAQQNLSTEQRIANAEKIFQLENDLAKRSSTGPEQQKKLIENRQNLSSAILAIADDQIQKEIENQKKVFDSQKADTQAILFEQLAGAELLASAQIKLLDKRLLSEKQYTEEVIKINQAKNEALGIANTNFALAEKTRVETEAANLKALEEVNFQLKLQDISDRDASEQEIKQALRDAQYSKELQDLDDNLAAQKISYDTYLASISLADKKYAADTKKNDKILADQKKAQNVSMLTDGLNALGSLFEGSKAVAVAQALVNTYQGISAGVALGYPAAIPAVAAAAATGFAAVKNILKTSKASSGGESGTATPRTTSGTGSFINSVQTETVAKVSDTPQQQNTIVSPPVLILEQLNEMNDNLKVKMTSG